MECLKCSKEIPVPDAQFCPWCGASQVKKDKPARRTKTRGNGTGTVYKRGRTWTAMVVVGWRFRNGDPTLPKVPVKKTKGGFQTRTDALNAIPSLLAKSTDRRRITLEELWREWSEGYEKRVGASTFAGYLAAFKWFKPLHGIYIDSISIKELQNCLDNCTAGKRTHQMMKTTAGLLWRYAVANNLADRDLSETLHTGDGKSVQREPLTDDEIETIRASIGLRRYADYVICLVYLGLRPGEFLSLKKTQLHFYRKEKKDGSVTEIWYLIAGGKTEAGKDRIIPIHKDILPIVLDRCMVPGTDLLFPRYSFERNGKNFIKFIPMLHDYFRKFVFVPMMKALGLDDSKVPYSARHSFADWLKAADGTEKSKAALVGHSDYLFTAARYQSDQIEELAALVDSMR